MDTEITQHSHPRRRRRLGALLLLSLVSGSIGAGALSLALFTDVDTATANDFSTGTIVLTATPASAAVHATSMMPGDVVYGNVDVKNDGTAQLRYAMSSAWTDGTPSGLSTTLGLEVQLVAASTTAPATACSSLTWNATNDIWNGTASGAKIGSSAVGAQAGDQTLDPGYYQRVCFKATLPSTATAQAVTTSGTLTFNSEQTAHNP